MALYSTTSILYGFARSTRAALSFSNLLRTQPALISTLLLVQRRASPRNSVYNVLWAVVFGFATLNILSLAARRFEPNRRGLTFGELLAVLVVLLSIFLLGWELFGVFHIFPIKLRR